MANEATLRYSPSSHGPVIQDYTCADGSGIEKGSLLRLIDPRTAVLSNTDDEAIAGILAREKIASDGRTRVSVIREGDFDMVAGAAITVGDAVAAFTSTSGANIIHRALGVSSGAHTIGYALETATAGETIQVRLRL